MNIPVVAINVYSVPQGKEADFLLLWQELKETLLQGPGFLRGKLHRSFQASARFNFINVVEWENAHYSQAYEQSVPWMKSKLTDLGVETTPAMFAVVSEY